MALTVLEVMPDAGRLDVRILATDINTKVLREARHGVYPREALSSAPPALVERWFAPHGSGLIAGDELKKLIAFRPLNLMGEWPMKGHFDVVFCRNVAIYFDEDVQATIWRRIAERLHPGGRLCIGHSERIGGPASDMLVSDGVTAYRRKDAR